MINVFSHSDLIVFITWWISELLIQHNQQELFDNFSSSYQEQIRNYTKKNILILRWVEDQDLSSFYWIIFPNVRKTMPFVSWFCPISNRQNEPRSSFKTGASKIRRCNQSCARFWFDLCDRYSDMVINERTGCAESAGYIDFCGVRFNLFETRYCLI